MERIYDKFNPAGFGILAYSLDVYKDKYQEFIDKNKLNWLSFTDLKGSESEIYKLFNLSSIPWNFLIDEDNKIVEVNIKPGKLLSFLEEEIQD